MKCYNVTKKIVLKIKKKIKLWSIRKTKENAIDIINHFGLQLIRSFKNAQINCNYQIRTGSIFNSLAKKRLSVWNFYAVRYIHTHLMLPIFFSTCNFFNVIYYQV